MAKESRFRDRVAAVRKSVAFSAGPWLERPAQLYREAGERWQQFGNLPERAYALLGQGRCLRGLGEPEAEGPLREAHELFALMGYTPALAETEALLGESAAAAV